MPITKTAKGYRGIISDTSIDRDDEFMGKELIDKWGKKDFYLPILLDHENKVLSNVGKWVDKEVIQNKGHNALKVSPYFFESNPNSKIVKGMLDEGAELGLSIGAIPKGFEEVDIDGERFRKWTDAELVEASFVPVASNRNSYAAVAKSFNLEENYHKINKSQGGKNTMSETEEEIKKTLEEAKKTLAEAEAIKKEAEDKVKEDAEAEAKAKEEAEAKEKADAEKYTVVELQKQMKELFDKNEAMAKTLESRSTKLKGFNDEMTAPAGKDKTVAKTSSIINMVKAYRKGAGLED